MHLKSSVAPMLFALLLGAGALLLPRPAQAQFCYLVYGYPVGICATEGTQWANQATLLKNVTSEINKIRQMEQQLTQEKNRLEALKTGNFGLNVSTTERVKIAELKQRDLSYGMDGMCVKGKSSVAEEQLKYCRKGVEIRNRRYNALVQMFKDMDARDAEIRALEKDSKSVPASNIGRIEKNTAKIAQVRAQIQIDMQNNVALLKSYEKMIEAIDGEMALLASKALVNKKTGKDAIGQIAQGAMLSAGLKVARSRDM
ncbi:hypothetical protein MCC10113_2111 [Bifidobacterium longum subsp. longum]|uniref:Type IV secretion protein VirB5a n=3 Tax=Bacteria TaxID=2 RepID=A0AAU9ANQ1_LYSEN|nr:hypothetical protein [Lysobacter enzymogenes]TCF54854.1 hypothetical protein MCC10113_2111 [Bifidobacterium longum subsp. longum]BAV97703.1 Type IV secretion protein VirB5a [Lysobacter enzymogenes]